MKFYNTDTQQVERVLINREPVNVYICRIARHHPLHLGNAFTYAMADNLIRYLEFERHRVKFIQAVVESDDESTRPRVEDDADGAMPDKGWPPQLIRTMQTLNIRPPDAYSIHHASEHRQVAMLTLGAPTACIWLHTAVVECRDAEPGTATSNLIMMEDLLTRYSPDALRFYLASHHYRRPWSFSWKALARATEQARVVAQAASVRGGHRRPFDPTVIKRCVLAALNDDLNTCNALSALLYLADEILAAASVGSEVTAAQSSLRALSWIFGLRLDNLPETRVVEGWQHQTKLLAHPTSFQADAGQRDA